MPYKIISLLVLNHLVLGADFIKMPNSVVDKQHHLQWQDTPMLQGYEEKWDMSRQHCVGLHLESFSDWRLPTKKELILLAQNRASKASFLHLQKQIFWSVNEDKNNPLNAYTIYIGNGHKSSNDKCETNNVICVRTIVKLQK